MTFSDETLMAYVDHEVDAATAAAIDAAVARDPELAARVARQRGLRAAVKSSFDPVLHEPLPARLLAAIYADSSVAAPAPSVVDFAAARAAKTAAISSLAPPRRRAWLQWGAMAASVALGIVIGGALLGRGHDSMVVTDGQLLARGALAKALSDQLASTQPETAPVRVGLTFESREGEYCRTFTLQQTTPIAGLACHSGSQWRVQLVEQRTMPTEAPAPDRYRIAGADIPPSVLRAVDERIKGNPLDADAERAARGRGWNP